MMPEYEKMGVEVVEDGQNLPPPSPVGIGLTDLKNIGGPFFRENARV